MPKFFKILSKSKFFRFGEVKSRPNLVVKFNKIEKKEDLEERRANHWVALLLLLAIVIGQSFYPSNRSKASSQTSISKTSTADFAQGSNSGIDTSSDEAKISAASGWADSNYAFRKEVDVSAKAANPITKGHTLNLAGVGSGTFDGAGDYFNAGTTFNESLPVTVEAWVNLSAYNSAIFSSKELGTSNYSGFWMYVDSGGGIFLSYGDNTGQVSQARRSKSSASTVSLNTWTHITGVIRGATDMSIYINGVDANGSYSGSGGNMANAAGVSATIGYRNIAVNPMMKGNIDELRVWSKARSLADIQADMYKEIDAQSNLDAYYKFNQSSGTLADLSGNSHTGTAVGNADYSPYSNVWGGINTKALVDAGKMRFDGNDLRLYYGSTEIERELIPATGKNLSTSEATQVLFKAQAAVTAGSTDTGYYLYYGNSGATDPIVNVYEKKFRTKNAYISPYNGDGANYLQYNSDNFPTNGDGTLEYWFKYSNNVGRRAYSGPVMSGEDTNNVWSWWNDRWGYRAFAKIGGNDVAPSDPGNYNDGREWNHTVITWHNTDTTSEIKIYENNVKTADVTGAKITSWPNYLKFTDSYAQYDGIEMGMVGVFNTAKDASWVASEFTRSSPVPVADGVRDASATLIHNFDGSGLDATLANGGYALGTSTAVNQGTIMSGDYRQGDTNDERGGNSWVSGVYNWYDNFDSATVKTPGWTELGNISPVSSELSLPRNSLQNLVNKSSAKLPTSYRLDVSAKGTQPEILFNHQDRVGWWGNNTCSVNVTGGNDVYRDIMQPRDTPTNFLTGNTSKYYLSMYNGFIPKYIQFDIGTNGSYSGVVWEYWNGSAWTVFTPTTDGTVNFSKSGIVDVSNISASYGMNAPADGDCGFNGNFNVIRVSASTVTTAAKINHVNRIYDYAKLSYTTTTNAIAGDSHNATGSTAITRSASVYSQIGLRRVGTGLQSYFDGRQTINATTNAVFDSNLIGLSSTTDATFDNFKLYKALADEPTASTLAEVAKYPTGAYYLSPSSTQADSGVINLGWIGGWATPKGFSANVTIPANTTIDFKVRSSAVGGANDADWTDWGTLGTASQTGEFSVATASMPNITLGSNKYLQVKAIFNTTDGLNSPSLSDYTIYYIADSDAPSNPTVSSLTVNGTAITSETWTSSNGAVLANFSGSTDPESQSGVAGYYVYFGTSISADPAVDGVYQAHVGAAGDSQTYTSTISTSDDGKYYYLIVKTKDGAGNISNQASLYQFGYDKTVPTQPSFVSVSPAGYTTVNLFDFTWPAGSDPAGPAGASGVKYYEYRRGNEGSWSHTLDQSQTSVIGLTAYQEGVNVFFVRTVDKANNTSTNYAQVSYYWSGSAPGKPTTLQVSPEAAAENQFTISWNKPVVGEGDPAVTGYYYSVNEAPTTSNVTYVASTAANVSLGPDHFATKQGLNTIYVLSTNELGNRSFEAGYIASTTFTCETSAPPIPLNVSISDTTNRAYSIYSLMVKWSAGSGQDQTAFDHYIIERSTDGVNFSTLATTASTAYIDASSLSNSTTYYYRITSVDNAQKSSAVSSVVSRMPTGKYQTPPSYLAQPSTSDIKSSSAKVSWTTDRASNSIVRYGKKTDTLDASSGKLDSVMSHVVDLLGLEPSTTYYYKVQSLDNERDYAPEDALSEAQSFTTLSSPAISNVNVSNITLSSVDVSWETTTLAESSLYYGTNSSFDKKLDDISGSNTTKHSVKITDLANSSRYSFKITGVDTDNNELTSDHYTFETLPMPRVDSLKLDVVKDQARPSIKVTWVTNVPSSSIVKYSAADQVEQEQVKSKLTTEHEITLSNLSDQTNYRISAQGMDSIGNLTVPVSSTILTPQDTRPPTISDITIETSNVGLNRQDKAQAVVSWRTDEPATSRIEYGAGLGGDNFEKQTNEDTNLTTNHVVILSDLEPTSPYHLKVDSKDKVGNLAKSDNQVVISSEVPKSVLRVLLNALQQAFGWIRI